MVVLEERIFRARLRSPALKTSFTSVSQRSVKDSSADQQSPVDGKMRRRVRPSLRGAVGWLYRHHEPLPPECRHSLLTELLERKSSFIIVSVATLLMAGLAHAIAPEARWPYLWVVADLTFLAARLVVGKLAQTPLERGDERPFELFAIVTMMSCLTLGFGAYACFSVANPLLIGVTLGFLAGVAAGITSRNSAFPRSAIAAELLVSAPFFIGAAISRHPWFFIFAAQQLAGITANVGLTRANYQQIRKLLLAERENSILALHDSLTGLANRKLLRDQLDNLVEKLTKPEADVQCAAVLCLDLDGFKQVNDTYGHPAGDALLQVVAHRLQFAVRDTDIVARTGGDEFVILLPQGDSKLAEGIAARIIAAIAQPYEVGRSTPITIGVTIGIALAPFDGGTSDVLLSRADRALYVGKHTRRGTYTRYSRGSSTI